MRRLVTLWGLALACAPARPLPLPIDEGAVSLLLIEPTADHLLGIDVSTGEGLAPGALRDDRPLYARSYAAPLSSLGLSPGLTPLVGPGPGNRPLPPGLATHRAELNSDPPSWTALSEDQATQELANVYLPPAQEGCEIDGGCWITQRGEPVCVLPCPTLPPVVAPAVPTEPELPRLTPCPTHWRTTTSTLNPDVERCVPPELDCPPGEYRSLADAACVPEVCPADGWPANIPPGAIHVDPNATGPEDGSAAAPFARLATALGAATQGNVLVLRVGEHPAGLSLGGVRLLGACRARVILLPSVGRTPTLSAASGVVGLRGLTIRSAVAGLGFRVLRGARAELDEVTIEGGSGAAVVDSTGALRAQRTTFTGLAALVSANGGVVELVASRLQGRSTSRCLDAINTELTLTDLDINGCGDAVTLNGGTLRGERLSLRGPDQEGLTFSGSTTATISDLYVAGGANGVLLQPTAHLALSRYFATGLQGRGISATGATLALQDLLLESTRETGLELRQSSVVARRVAMTAVGRNGLYATGGQTQLEDLRVVEVRAPTPGLQLLYGLQLDGPTRLARVELTLGAGPGLYFRSVAGARNELELEDLSIAALPAPRYLPAVYWVSGFNANIEARRVRVRDWPGIGISLQGATAAITDLELEAHGDSGFEVADASLNLTRARISGTSTVAMEIDERAGSTRVELEALEIRRAAGSYGIRTKGLASGTHLASLRDFRIVGPAAAAFDIDYVFYLELERGRIEDSQVGLRLEQPSFALTAVEKQVYFLNVPQKVDLRCRTTSPDCQD